MNNDWISRRIIDRKYISLRKDQAIGGFADAWLRLKQLLQAHVDFYTQRVPKARVRFEADENSITIGQVIGPSCGRRLVLTKCTKDLSFMARYDCGISKTISFEDLLKRTYGRTQLLGEAEMPMKCPTITQLIEKLTQQLLEPVLFPDLEAEPRIPLAEAPEIL